MNWLWAKRVVKYWIWIVGFVKLYCQTIEAAEFFISQMKFKLQSKSEYYF